MIDENSPFEYDDESVSKPKYKGYTTTALYIPMRDGVKIALDVHLPKKLAPDQQIPTVLIQTRYWRSYNFKIPFKWLIKAPRKPLIAKGLTSYGFAVVWVDVRGTGASFGTRQYPFSQEEIQDTTEIVNWIISQPWSNKAVVTYGNSYSGVTSELTATSNHPAVKAILTGHNPWDFYMHAAFPCGCFNKAFISYWSKLGKALDTTEGKNLKPVMKSFDPFMATLASLAVRGVMPVDNDKKKILLREAAKIHASNSHPIDHFEKVKVRDDPLTEDGLTIDDLSTFSKKKMIEKNPNLPFYVWGSWQDSTTANAIIHRFLNFDIPQKAVIGDWCHRQKNRANPFFSHKAHAQIDKYQQIREWVKFFHDCLNGKFGRKKELYYYTMGEERWKKTDKWPPENQEMMRFFLGKNLLSPTAPTEETGSDNYTVDYEVTTGIRNRWYTLLSLPINYGDRKDVDSHLLCYTSEPLEESIEITGHPIVHLFLRTTHEDGMIIVHFEFLDSQGKVHWITDGQLRLPHRKLSEEEPPYQMVIPYHSHESKDVQPMIPGEVTEIIFALYPTSILLPRGSRLRIAIAGADKDTFARYPEEGTPTLSIERNKNYASFIDFPRIMK
ncbi:MAG: CocE/NonD family hydrolase [Candidatus Helarchaeota archaeon]